MRDGGGLRPTCNCCSQELCRLTAVSAPAAPWPSGTAPAAAAAAAVGAAIAASEGGGVSTAGSSAAAAAGAAGAAAAAAFTSSAPLVCRQAGRKRRGFWCEAGLVPPAARPPPPQTGGQLRHAASCTLHRGIVCPASASPGALQAAKPPPQLALRTLLLLLAPQPISSLASATARELAVLNWVRGSARCGDALVPKSSLARAQRGRRDMCAIGVSACSTPSLSQTAAGASRECVLSYIRSAGAVAGAAAGGCAWPRRHESVGTDQSLSASRGGKQNKMGGSRLGRKRVSEGRFTKGGGQN